MKKWLIPVIVIVVLAVAAGAFFGGRAAASSGTPSVEEAMKALQGATPEQLQQVFANGGGTGGNFPGGPGGGTTRFQGGGAVTGTIISSDANSITVKTGDGSTKIVLISASTPISKTSEGSAADLTAGQNVIVTGTTNSDGTVIANRVQVGASLPAFTDGRGQGPNGAAPGPAGAAPGSGTGAGPSDPGAAPGGAGGPPGSTTTP